MAEETPEAALKQIETPLRLTHAGLWAERLVRAFWPLWTLLVAGIAVLALFDRLALEASWTALVLIGAGALGALVHGGRRFEPPSRMDALARLDSRLPGRPIAALLDQLAPTEDPATRALWAAHRARMAERAAAARPVEPDLRLASRDPYALRYMALLLLALAGFSGALWRLGDGTPFPGEAAAQGPTWEGWAIPPAYTAKPRLYLRDQTAEALILPQGTRLDLRFYGAPGALILSETVSGRTEVPPASDMAQEFTVTRSGRLSIEGKGGQDWLVTMQADQPPAIAAEGPIERDGRGRFKQAFSASDDYGIAKGEVTIALDLDKVDRRYGLALPPEPLAPVTLDLPLPQKRDRRAVAGMVVDDLSDSVLANLPTTLRFAAQDAAGQKTESPPLAVSLPGRRFFDPLAAAVVEQRRDLLWNRENAPRIADVLRAILWEPEGREDPIFRDRSTREGLRALIPDLALPMDDAKRDRLAKSLWDLALKIEDGELADAKAALDRAQDRLDEAMRRGASPAEIDRLMKDMRKALDDYLRQEAAKAPDGPDEPNPADEGQKLSQDQIQQMLDRIQELMKEGRTAEAQALMEELRQMMENMQVQKGQGQGEGQGQSGPGGQAMKDLGQGLRDQQGLSDDAFREMQRGEGGEGLAERQEALRQRMEELRRGGTLPGAGTDEGEAGRQALDDAGRAMDEAEEALRNGDLPGALDRQAEALDGLREGIRQLGAAQDKAEANRAADGESFAQEGEPGQRDPLGRESGTAGQSIGSQGPMLQGEDVYRRAEDLLDEIRRRAGEQDRSSEERGYLRRLLDLF